MRDLPKYLNPLISSILANDINAVQVENLPFYYYMGDRLVDMKLFFQTAVQQSRANPDILDNFVEFIQKSLIYRFDNRGKLPSKNRNDVNYSGVGMLLFGSQSDLLKYNKFQALHDLQLFQLFHKILPS